MTLSKIDLGIRGIRFLKDELSFDNLLAKNAKKAVESTPGDCFTYLPNEVDNDRVFQFQSGGIHTSPQKVYSIGNFKLSEVPDLRLWLCSYLKSELSSTAQTLLFDDVMASPGDMELISLKDTYLIIDENVFHNVNYFNIDKLKDVVNAVQLSWHFLCVVVNIANSNLQEIDFYKSINKVIVGAYDGEGYVIWQCSQAR